MAKRPDRFERMVGRVKGKFHYIEANTEGYLISDSDVITLLRKEHLAVVRVVRNAKGTRCQYEDQQYGCLIDKGELLSKLTERAK